MADVVAVHLIISGVVQGVNYRANTEHQARVLGLVGWVRNRTDGTVEAHAQGSKDAIEKFVQWCQRGPQMAKVDHVKRTDVSVDGSHTAFVRHPTG